MDPVTSLAIDAGDPTSSTGDEPAPNGGRRNTGAYGGTAEASRTTTAPRAIQVLAANGGEIWAGFQAVECRIQGTGWQIADTVRLEYSDDGGVGWALLPGGTNVPATQSRFWWDTRSVPDQYGYLLRASCEQDPQVTDVSDGQFAIDNYAPPALTVNDARLTEGNSGTQELQFTVTLSHTAGTTVTVQYATTNQTAAAGSDYTAAVGLLTFPPGTGSHTVSVPVFGDRLIEDDEVFWLLLRNPTNAILATSTGVGTIVNDDGLPGHLDRYTWDPIPSPQIAGQPFPVTLRGLDRFGAAAVQFQGTADLSALQGGGETAIGSGAIGWEYPLSTYYHDARTQVIYRQDELGGPGILRALAIDLHTAPTQVLNQWTIRLKHTPLAQYTNSLWESEGWTVVHQTNLSLTTTGWVSFEFTQPFDYDGVHHLLIDFSYNNTSLTANRNCTATDTGVPRSLTYRSDSRAGDPLTWSGSTPTPNPSTRIPNLHLQIDRPVTLDPLTAGPFTNGLWSGWVTIPNPALVVHLRASDPDEHPAGDRLQPAAATVELPPRPGCPLRPHLG
jgi:hypothetical protein